MDVRLIERICRRRDGMADPEAMDFLANYWARYCHEVDDIVDGDRPGKEELLETLALAIELYSHPFYLKHLSDLRRAARNVTGMYANTVAWEKSLQEWERTWADMHRHCSLEMVLAVAEICGGYRHRRILEPELRRMAYWEHHDAEGKPR